MLYLGTNNQLYYPAANRTINACRAYFQLKGLTVGDPASLIKEFRLFFGEEDAPDGIGEIKNEKLKMKNEEEWYDLNGRKLSEKPSQKGIYIHNGRKEAVK